jgi:DNA-binding NtrC family response regulator
VRLSSQTLTATVVLIVEDEKVIMLGLVEEFERAGFIALEAANANEAIAILHASAHGVDVLFADIGLPGLMNGLLLAQYASQHWPSLAVIIASGFDEPSAADMPASAMFFAKPYDTSQVIIHAGRRRPVAA